MKPDNSGDPLTVPKQQVNVAHYAASNSSQYINILSTLIFIISFYVVFNWCHISNCCSFVMHVHVIWQVHDLQTYFERLENLSAPEYLFIYLV